MTPLGRQEEATSAPIPELVESLLASNLLLARDLLHSIGYSRKEIDNIEATKGYEEMGIAAERQSLSISQGRVKSRAIDLFYYASECKRACSEQRWSDVIYAIYAVGISQGGVLVHEMELGIKQKGSANYSSKTGKQWEQILKAADDFASSKPRNYPATAIHKHVMAIPGMPWKCLSGFCEHWKAHKAKINSKC